MAMTSPAFIHENDDLENLNDAIDVFMQEVTSIENDLYTDLHRLDMQAYFEATTNAEEKIAKAKKNAFARIGDAILKLIQKVREFLERMLEKINIFKKKQAPAEEIVTKMLKDHPELKSQILNGLNKEWFTVKDVAAFEKDVVGLINMLNSNAIDHATFKEKFDMRLNKFHQSASPVVAVSNDAGSVARAISSMFSACGNTRKAIINFTKFLKDGKIEETRKEDERKAEKEDYYQRGKADRETEYQRNRKDKEAEYQRGRKDKEDEYKRSRKDKLEDEKRKNQHDEDTWQRHHKQVKDENAPGAKKSAEATAKHNSAVESIYSEISKTLSAMSTAHGEEVSHLEKILNYLSSKGQNP